MIERLTPTDRAMLWPDKSGWRQDIGVIAILDPTGIVDHDGNLDIVGLRERVGGRLDRAPRFRQVLCRPRVGLGGPFWQDVATVDLEHHVRVRPIDPPGDRDQLLAACEEIRNQPFDTGRPLWEMWFLPGLADDHVGLFIKLHHSAADGVAGVVALGAFVDTDPGPATSPSGRWTAHPPATALELLLDTMTRRLRGLTRLVSGLAHPVRTARNIIRQWRVVRSVFSEPPAPRISFNLPIGPHRRLSTIGGDLDTYRRIAHTHDATINDVLLSVMSEGLRDLLAARGELTADLEVRAMVPVSLHPVASSDSQGNHSAGMLVPLPVGEPDRLRRLQNLISETRRRKSEPHPSMGTGFLQTSLVQRLGLTVFVGRQRLGNVYITNVPGPPMPLYLGGARILELYPVVPIIGNISIGVGALSYAGHFNITVVVDRDLVPDVDVLVEGARGAVDELANISVTHAT